MRSTITIVAALCAVTATAPAAAAMKGAALARLARVPPSRARHIAVAARPGAIKDEELEREKGGSGLRYSFDILSRGKLYEVGVDAKTGAVLENGVDEKAD